MNTLALNMVLQDAENRLSLAGISDARSEARLLLELAGLPRHQQVTDPFRTLPEPIAGKFSIMLTRRLRREPFSHLRGVKEFWSREFIVTEHVLAPRPDSETLIEALRDHRPDRDATYAFLDFGTGSGCLLVTALAEYPLSHGLGLDLDPRALCCARENARRLGIGPRAAFVCGHWADALTGAYDVILANPPYVALRDRLPPEVALYEPSRALFGGRDGLDCYRALLPALGTLLKPRGLVFLEIGCDQAETVQTLAQRVGLRVRECRRDLAGRDRCLVLAP
ncbi:MAG TPA: peptide chain release factor N(5)-glutamine methyltransferase [Dongiaceae bacterium]|jgi:release factor glutamine methyltransferase|nr:peptide chain release factor N(5)-glutamine methyltransferase [Dongiaceae bacterium]